MADALDTITKLIQSPPGQLAAGGVLAGIVFKFFERVEVVLTENTKLEIANWLRGMKVGQKVEPWPKILARSLDPRLGEQYGRFWLITVLGVSLSAGIANAQNPEQFEFVRKGAAGIGATIIVFAVSVVGFWVFCAYYFAFFKARFLLEWCSQKRSGVSIAAALLVDFIVTIGLGVFSAMVLFSLMSTPEETRLIAYVRPYDSYWACVFYTPAKAVFVYPAFSFSIWLWLYVGSGFLLKAALRFDLGFEWFNRKFDIEKKPLSSIGLVAGALVAMVYWAAVIVNRVVK